MQLFAFEVLEPVEQIEQVFVLFEEAVLVGCDSIGCDRDGSVQTESDLFVRSFDVCLFVHESSFVWSREQRAESGAGRG